MCVKPVGNDGKSLWIGCRKLAVAAVETSLQSLWKASGRFADNRLADARLGCG
jgi:hypothetical protein